jgi:hypothetical protein
VLPPVSATHGRVVLPMLRAEALDPYFSAGSGSFLMELTPTEGPPRSTLSFRALKAVGQPRSRRRSLRSERRSIGVSGIRSPRRCYTLHMLSILLLRA